jgi:hypothetical protein
MDSELLLGKKRRLSREGKSVPAQLMLKFVWINVQIMGASTST